MGVLALSVAASSAALGMLNVPAAYRGWAGSEPRAFTPPRPALLIVVDGLREDAARSMPTLQRIAQRGTSARLVAGVPTFSAAAYVTLLTGTGSLSSGRRTNERLFAADLDSVPARLSRQGRTARVISDEVDWWETLLPGQFTDVAVLPTAQVFARAERWMADSDLLVVHLCAVDAAGHDKGASSAAYSDAVRATDGLVAKLAERWGDRGILTVLSDHGHTASGGHGGAEDEVRNTWWVSAGPGLTPHTHPEDLPSVDVAPTLAAWLGTPPPMHAEGRTRTEWVEGSASRRAQLQEQDNQRIAGLARARDDADQVLAQQRLRDRTMRGAGVVVLALVLAWPLRRSLTELAAGAFAGVLALTAAAGLSWFLWGPPSFSAAALPGFISLRSAGLLLICATATVPWTFTRLRLLGVAGASAFPAALLYVFEGAFAERALTSDPMIAVLPLVLWPVAGAGALFALACLIIGPREAVAPRARRSDRLEPG